MLGQDVQLGKLEGIGQPVRGRLGRHRLAHQVVPPLAGLGRVAVPEADEHAVVVERGAALEPVVLGVPSRGDRPLRPRVVGVAHRQDVDVHRLVDACRELPPVHVWICGSRMSGCCADRMHRWCLTQPQLRSAGGDGRKRGSSAYLWRRVSPSASRWPRLRPTRGFVRATGLEPQDGRRRPVGALNGSHRGSDRFRPTADLGLRPRAPGRRQVGEDVGLRHRSAGGWLSRAGRTRSSRCPPSARRGRPRRA